MDARLDYYLFHLARIALTFDKDAIETYIQHLASELRPTDKKLSNDLFNLIAKHFDGYARKKE